MLFTIEEIIKQRFDYFNLLGLPLTVSRYYIKVITEVDLFDFGVG